MLFSRLWNWSHIVADIVFSRPEKCKGSKENLTDRLIDARHMISARGENFDSCKLITNLCETILAEHTSTVFGPFRKVGCEWKYDCDYQGDRKQCHDFRTTRGEYKTAIIEALTKWLHYLETYCNCKYCLPNINKLLAKRKPCPRQVPNLFSLEESL